MQLSGQIMPHDAQPVHASGAAIVAKGYPLLFTSIDIFRTSSGHVAVQTPQPLHLSVSTTIVPLILAILNKYIFVQI